MIKHGNFFGHPYLEIRMKKIRDFTIKEENFNETYVRSVIDSLLIITDT